MNIYILNIFCLINLWRLILVRFYILKLENMPEELMVEQV